MTGRILSWKLFFTETLYKLKQKFCIFLVKLNRKLLMKITGDSASFKNLIFDTTTSDYLIAEGREFFVVGTKDRIIARDLHAEGHFEFDKVETAFRLAGLKMQNDNLYFIDVGANVGSTCIPVINRKLASRALAVEPVPTNVKYLKTNIALNDLDGKIEVIPVALGETVDDTLTMELSGDNFGDHRIRSQKFSGNGEFDEDQRKTIEVKSTTLDDLLKTYDFKKAFLWLDTQGYEGFILSGGHRVLDRKFPLVMEFWPYAMQRSNSFDKLCDGLCASPYSYFIDLACGDGKKISISKENLRLLYGQYSRFDAVSGSTDILVL